MLQFLLSISSVVKLGSYIILFIKISLSLKKVYFNLLKMINHLRTGTCDRLFVQSSSFVAWSNVRFIFKVCCAIALLYFLWRENASSHIVALNTKYTNTRLSFLFWSNSSLFKQKGKHCMHIKKIHLYLMQFKSC